MDRNVLYTTPTGEQVTVRRSTRAKFLQQENEQLQTYVKDLADSVSTNKQLLRELTASMRQQAGLDKQLAAKLIQSLQAENQVLEERVRRVTLERNDALIKAQSSDRFMTDALAKEVSGEHPLESELRSKRSILAEKEQEVQDLDEKCKALTDTIEEFNAAKESGKKPAVDVDMLMTEKYVRLKGICEKLEKELRKTVEGKEELEETRERLTSDLQRLNSMLKVPIFRPSHSVDLSEVPVAPTLSDLKFQDIEESEDCGPPDAMMKQLQLQKTSTHRKTLSQRVSAPLASFGSQGEQSLQANCAKMENKIKDLLVKVESLQDELQSSARRNALLLQDRYRLMAALDVVRRKQTTRPTVAKKGKTTSVLPPVAHTAKKHKKRGRASSNPLEYVEATEQAGIVPQTARNRGNDRDFSREEESLEAFEDELPVAEMPSMIYKQECEDFLQADSFLVDALSLEREKPE